MRSIARQGPRLDQKADPEQGRAFGRVSYAAGKLMDIADIPDPYCDDSADGRRRAVSQFTRTVGEGQTPPRWLMECIASLLTERLDFVAPKAASRPKRGRDSKFAAWFAVECDPAYQTMPRDRSGRYAAIGELLNCDPSKVERDAAAFSRSRRGTDSVLLMTLGRYAQLRGLAWPEAFLTFHDWYDTRPRGTAQGGPRKK